MLANHPYLYTRVSILAERLLSDTDIESLIEKRVSLTELLARISPDTSYSADEMGRNDDLDQILITLLLDELIILLRPLTNSDRDLLLYWAERFEISNLKAILRGKMNRQSNSTIRTHLVNMGSLTTLPVERLLQSDNTAELLRILETTPFTAIARDARRVFEQGQDLFDLDATIDRHYFTGLARRTLAAPHTSELPQRQLGGSIIDRVNLVWLLRYRFAYNLPPAQTYYLLIPHGLHLSSQKLLSLCQRESLTDVIEHLPEGLSSVLGGARCTSEVIRRLEHHTWVTAQKILNYSLFNPISALAYLILRERDLRRLRAVIRGKRLQLDPELIRIATGLISTDLLCPEVKTQQRVQ